MKSLFNNVVFMRQSGAVAAGVTTVDLAAIEVKNYGGVAWWVATATQADTGVCELVAQGRNDSADSWEDLEAEVSHTSTGAETQNTFGLELRSPPWRYVRLSIRRSVANTAIETAVAMLTDPQLAPVIPDTDFQAIFLSPEAA